ncbi:MAG: pyridoxal-phosphate dependent enzyme [Acidobacteriaceae bacterium]
MPAFAYLECSRCHYRIWNKSSSAVVMPASVCPRDGGALFVRYDMEVLKARTRRERPAELAARRRAGLGMWRYAEVLPDVTPVSLGEGWTPLRQSRRCAGLMVKDEAVNPTGTAEARGLAMAVSMVASYDVRQMGVRQVAASSPGLAAYAAAGGMKAHLFLPRDLASANYLEAVAHGAEVHLVDGSFAACEQRVEEEMLRRVGAGSGAEDLWFNLSALHEPFRLEGEKTIGYELVEQFGWMYPDALVYPHDAEISLMGAWKAFEEMEELGWVTGRRPRVYVGQPAKQGLDVEKDKVVLEIATSSGGRVVELDSPAIVAALQEWAREEGMLLSQQSAAAAAAYAALLASGEIDAGQQVVVVKSTDGLRDAEGLAKAMHLRPSVRLPTSLPVGGIIAPV